MLRTGIKTGFRLRKAIGDLQQAHARKKCSPWRKTTSPRFLRAWACFGFPLATLATNPGFDTRSILARFGLMMLIAAAIGCGRGLSVSEVAETGALEASDTPSVGPSIDDSFDPFLIQLMEWTTEPIDATEGEDQIVRGRADKSNLSETTKVTFTLSACPIPDGAIGVGLTGSSKPKDGAGPKIQPGEGGENGSNQWPDDWTKSFFGTALASGAIQAEVEAPALECYSLTATYTRGTDVVVEQARLECSGGLCKATMVE